MKGIYEKCLKLLKLNSCTVGHTPQDVEMEWQKEGFTELQSKEILHSNFISQVYDETNNLVSLVKH